jgi:hypothetical protein
MGDYFGFDDYERMHNGVAQSMPNICGLITEVHLLYYECNDELKKK